MRVELPSRMDAPSTEELPEMAVLETTELRKVLPHRCLLRSSSIRINGGEESRRPLEAHTPMSTLQHVCQLLYDSHIGTMIRESDTAFPIIESVHVLAVTLLVGTIALLDLRMLGIVLRRIPVTQIARTVFPLTWSGFAIMFVSGFLLFWAEAAKNYSNPAFRVKLILLALVGLNPLIFHTTIYRRVHEWEILSTSPWRARAAAVASLTLWSGVIVAGRLIAYF